jgi:hypothetical protein
MTRPCECGLALRPPLAIPAGCPCWNLWPASPRRLFGFPAALRQAQEVGGAPCFFTGSIALGGCGLPSTDSLSGFASAGKGKIQGWAEFQAIGLTKGGRNGNIHAIVDGIEARGC